MQLGLTVDVTSAFFLICFLIGLLTSLGALLLGGHGQGDPGHGGTGDAGHAHFGHAGATGDHAFANSLDHGVDSGHGAPGQAPQSGRLALGHFLNLNTILAFLLGFGAAGFIARQWVQALLPVFLAAIAGGLVFGYLVHFILVKILLRKQSPYLQPADFDPRGVQATVNSTIFANRLGEIGYTWQGSYWALPARSRDGREIKKGSEVVILEVVNGIALVVTLAELRQKAEH